MPDPLSRDGEPAMAAAPAMAPPAAAAASSALAAATPAPADGYELVIGIETHIQLATASKMFCPCPSDYDGAEPNTVVCPICLGLPGSLPRPNRRAVELALRTGLAVGADIETHTYFERKNYHYPDLPKGYQISQYLRPLCRGGALATAVHGDDGRLVGTRVVGLERLHLEEDTAKLFHVGNATFVDFNRSGVPLVEIVSQPDMRSAEEAKAYLEALRHLLRWLGVSTANMEAGALRADVNVSVRRVGDEALGAKVEVKNLNSFAAVVDALRYERVRQITAIEAGEVVRQETRGWSELERQTVSQRSKEQAHDYRYFPEPDLPPLVVDDDWLRRVRAALPELPDALRARYMATFGLAGEEARLLTRDRATADYFEAAVAAYGGAPGEPARLITGVLFGLLNAAGSTMEAAAARVSPAALAELVRLVDEGELSKSAARDVLARMFDRGEAAATIVAREGLGQISDRDALRRAVAEVIAANPKAVADYRGGKPSALGFFVGGVMRLTRGQGNPALVRELVEAALAEPPA